MKNERLLDAIGKIDENLIQNAVNTESKKKTPVWLRWGAMAACLCLIIAGVIGVQSGWFGRKSETVMLSSGESITFRNAMLARVAIDSNAKITAIPADKLAEIFGALPVTDANAYFTYDETEFVGLEGKYDGMKLVISAPGVQLLDAVVVGSEEPSTVAGVPVTAGYFVTDANSQGIKTAIYYANIELDDCTVYVENAGTEAESAAVREAVALAVQQLIAAEIDFGAIASK